MKALKFDIENGSCQAARKFSTSTTGKVINKSSVQEWVTTYKGEMERKRKDGGEKVSTIIRVQTSCTRGDRD